MIRPMVNGRRRRRDRAGAGDDPATASEPALSSLVSVALSAVSDPAGREGSSLWRGCDSDKLSAILCHQSRTLPKPLSPFAKQISVFLN